MPRIKLAERGDEGQPATWQEQITARVRAGKLVPLTSASVGNDLVLGGQDALEDKYAKYSGYTLDQRNLPHVAQVRIQFISGVLPERQSLARHFVRFLR